MDELKELAGPADGLGAAIFRASSGRPLALSSVVARRWRWTPDALPIRAADGVTVGWGDLAVVNAPEPIDADSDPGSTADVCRRFERCLANVLDADPTVLAVRLVGEAGVSGTFEVDRGDGYAAAVDAFKRDA